MRRKVVHAVLGVSLMAAALAVPQGTVGAQTGWTGFTAASVPSGLQGGGANDSPAWSAAITEDLGGDGVDIWVNNHAERSEGLEDYVGGGGLFADASLSPLTGTDSHGPVWTDVDGDGDDDLIEVVGRNHDTRVFRNDNGSLTLLPTPTGLEDFRGRGRQALMVDIDNDGDMDAVIGNLDRTFLSEEDPPNPDDPAPSEVYLNDGTGTSWTKLADPDTVLTDGSVRYLQLTSSGPGTPPVILTSNTFAFAIDTIATGTTALTAAPAPVNPSVGATDNLSTARDFVLGDFDGDLAPEFIVVKQDDFLGTDNVGDFDEEDPPNPIGDGVPDLLGELPMGIGQVSTSPLSPRVVADISDDARIDNCRTAAAADFDNDGDIDVFAGCAMKEKTAQAVANVNVMLMNDGAGNFTIDDTLIPTTTDDTATVAVAADFNKDGWMDVYVGTGYDNQKGPDFIFLNNANGDGHYLQLDLVDADNPDVMGAQVFVGGTSWQVRETGHRAHQGQDTGVLHFGLGADTMVAPIEIQWPDGTFESCRIGDGSVDRRVTITKGGEGCEASSQAGMLAALAAAPDLSPPPDPGPFCRDIQVTVEIGKGESPTQGDDVILGTEGADVIDGLGGNDVICGLGGNDTINGGAGNDALYGDDGDDTLDGGDGNDRVIGGDGNDTMFGQGGRDIIQGGNGNDYAEGGKKNDRISGNGGKDTLLGGNGKDRVDGNNGADNINGGGGNDRLLGGGGNDTIDGRIGDDFCVEGETVIRCEFDFIP